MPEEIILEAKEKFKERLEKIDWNTYYKSWPFNESVLTLYNYLKTRMGTKWVLHFDDEVFLASINKAKWNIYAIALQDLTSYSLSYLNVFCNYKDVSKANETYDEILTKERKK